METHAELEAMILKCKECGRVFRTQRNLDLHEESAHKVEVIIKVILIL
jgi:uncharacterized C2H2 Zn-finger protein